MIGEKRNVCRLIMVKAEGKRPLGRPRRRWIDITVEFGDDVWGAEIGLVWIRIG
jgi:hypothetical protein